MDFKDVIHFYQGCKMIVYNEDKTSFEDILQIVSIYDDGKVEVWGDKCECVPIEDIKLILRSDETMTEDEETEYYELVKKVLHKKNPDDEKENILSTVDSPESFAYLIKKRFDIFKLKKTKNAIHQNLHYDTI